MQLTWRFRNLNVIHYSVLFFYLSVISLCEVSHSSNMKLDVTVSIIFLWGIGKLVASEDLRRNLSNYESSGSTETKHSRQKRYIVFPKGASLQLLLELLIQVPTQFRVVVGPTLQVAWPLPSDPFMGSSTTSSFQPSPPESIFPRKIFAFTSSEYSSRERQEKYRLFNDLAVLLNQFGMTVGLAWQLPDDPNIYSESKKKHKIYKRNAFKKMETFMKPGGSDGRQCVLRALCESGQRTPSKKEFLKEILHKIFSYNEENEDIEDTEEDKIYRKAHQSMNQNCEALYPDCSFSIFDALQ